MTLNSRRIVGQMVYGVTACGLLLSCSKVGHSEPDGTTYSRPDGWETVCVGHFLIDLPPSAHLGASEAKYKGTYGFEGINIGNAWGALRCGDVKILETAPVGSAGFEQIRLEGPGRKPSSETYDT